MRKIILPFLHIIFLICGLTTILIGGIAFSFTAIHEAMQHYMIKFNNYLHKEVMK